MRHLIIMATLLISLVSCSQPDGKVITEIQSQAKQLSSLDASIKIIEAKIQQNQEHGSGRFQIINGTPEMTRNIVLIDTETGRTWLMCDTKGVSLTAAVVDTGWCAMPVAGIAVVP